MKGNENGERIFAKNIQTGLCDKADDQLTAMTWDEDDLYCIFTDEEENQSVDSNLVEVQKQNGSPQVAEIQEQQPRRKNVRSLEDDSSQQPSTRENFLYSRRAPFLLGEQKIEPLVDNGKKPEGERTTRKPLGIDKRRERTREVSELPSWRNSEDRILLDNTGNIDQKILCYNPKLNRKTHRRPAVSMRSRIEQFQHRLTSATKLPPILEAFHHDSPSSSHVNQKFQVKIPSEVQVPIPLQPLTTHVDPVEENFEEEYGPVIECYLDVHKTTCHLKLGDIVNGSESNYGWAKFGSEILKGEIDIQEGPSLTAQCNPQPKEKVDDFKTLDKRTPYFYPYFNTLQKESAEVYALKCGSWILFPIYDACTNTTDETNIPRSIKTSNPQVMESSQSEQDKSYVSGASIEERKVTPASYESEVHSSNTYELFSCADCDATIKLRDALIHALPQEQESLDPKKALSMGNEQYWRVYDSISSLFSFPMSSPSSDTMSTGSDRLTNTSVDQATGGRDDENPTSHPTHIFLCPDEFCLDDTTLDNLTADCSGLLPFPLRGERESQSFEVDEKPAERCVAIERSEHGLPSLSGSPFDESANEVMVSAVDDAGLESSIPRTEGQFNVHQRVYSPNNPSRFDDLGYPQDHQSDTYHQCTNHNACIPRWNKRSLPASFQLEVWQHRLSLAQESLQRMFQNTLTNAPADSQDSVTANESDSDTDSESTITQKNTWWYE